MGKKEIIEKLAQEVTAYEIPLKHAPKTVLDIGANLGTFSDAAALKWPDALITAYEPIAELSGYIHENSCDRVKSMPFAVRGFTGHDEIIAGDCLATSSFHDMGRQGTTRIPVSCIDALELESAEFVKIDTEGCEVEILARLDLTNTKAIALEYHSNADKLWIENFLKVEGFIPYRNYSNGQTNGVLRYIRPDVELDLPKQKLFIGLPVYFAVDPHFWKCTMKLMAEFSVNCKIQPLVGDSLIPRARNSLSRLFLESDCTHILMVDSDLIFSNDQIKRIVSHNEDVVGGFYPKKKEGSIEMVCNALSPQPPMDERNLTPLKYIGSGFICISRRVFEKMIEVYGKDISYTVDEHNEITEHDFWACGVYNYPDGTKRYLSEDWYFCQRALDLGFTVYGDNNITLKHSGSAIYPLRYQMETQQIFTRSNSGDSAGTVSEAVSPRFHAEPALTT